MKTSITYKEIFKISYPIIIGYVIQNIISITDTAFLGHIGKIQLGAAAIGGIFYIAFIKLGVGFSIGTQIITARRVGENRISEIGKTIEHALYFLISVSILLILTINPLLPKILTLILQSEEIIRVTKEFLHIRFYGLLFAFINFSFRAFYIGIAKTKIITYTTILMALTNVFFDYALIFGNFGFPALGITGAAIASIIAEVLACLFFIIYTIRSIDLKLYGLFQFKKVSLSLLNSIIKTSLPIMLQSFIAFIGWFTFFLLIEKLGEQSLAISNIIRSIYVVMLIPMWGFASTTNTLVSYLIGNNRKEEVISLIFKIIRLSVTCLLVIIIINLFIPNIILSIYTNDLSLVADALPVINVICIAAISSTFGFMLFYGVSGTGMTNVTLLIETILVLLYIAGTYILIRIPSVRVQHVWNIETLNGLVKGMLSYFYLRHGSWTLKKI